MAPRAKRRSRRLPTRDQMVVGVEEIQEVFRALPDALQRTAVKTALEESAEVVLAALQRNVPRGATGVLEASLQIFPVRRAKTQSSIRVGTSTEGLYGRLLEYGFHPGAACRAPAVAPSRARFLLPGDRRPVQRGVR